MALFLPSAFLADIPTPTLAAEPQCKVVSLHQRVTSFENFKFSFNAEGAYSLFRHEAAGCATKVQSYNCKIDSHQDLSYVAALGVEAHGHSVVFAGGDAYLDGALMEKGPKGKNVIPPGEGTKGIVLVPYTPGVDARAPAMGDFGPGVSGYHLSFGEVKLNVTLTQTEPDSPNGFSFTNVIVMPSPRCASPSPLHTGLCSKHAWATDSSGGAADKGEHATSLAALQPSRPQGDDGPHDGPHALEGSRQPPELRRTGEIIGRLKAIAENGGICDAAKSAEQRQQQQEEARQKKQQQEAASPRAKQLAATQEASLLWKAKSDTARLARDTATEALQSKGDIFSKKLGAAGGRDDATDATMRAMGIGAYANEQNHEKQPQPQPQPQQQQPQPQPQQQQPQQPPQQQQQAPARTVKAPSNSTLPIVKEILPSIIKQEEEDVL